MESYKGLRFFANRRGDIGSMVVILNEVKDLAEGQILRPAQND